MRGGARRPTKWRDFSLIDGTIRCEPANDFIGYSAWPLSGPDLGPFHPQERRFISAINLWSAERLFNFLLATSCKLHAACFLLPARRTDKQTRRPENSIGRLIRRDEGRASRGRRGDVRASRQWRPASVWAPPRLSRHDAKPRSRCNTKGAISPRLSSAHHGQSNIHLGAST